MSRSAGDAAEGQALYFLQQQGLTLLQRNYFCRHGEIDLIMQDGATLVFIEVRQRAHHQAAANSIDEYKQQRLQNTAAYYLAGDSNPPTCRFDALLIDKNGKIQWLQNAFDATY